MGTLSSSTALTLDQTQFAAERDLVVTLLNRDTQMSRRVKGALRHGRGHIWNLSDLRGFNQREAIAGRALGGVVPALPGKIGPNGGRGPWR